MGINKNVCIVLLYVLSLTFGEEDNKWVWKNSGRRSDEREEGETNIKPRYDVYEEGPLRPGGFRPPQDFVRPGRPTGIDPDSGFPDGPFPNRPGARPPFVSNERPGGFGNYRPGPGGFRPDSPGILTGPVPSWVKEPPLKNFDRCKCAEKFNCNSPGISYGQCDVGKQYCCFNSHANGQLGGPLPSRPIHSAENGVLVGPGGPFDYPNRPHQRPGNFGNDNGVLVGPGGPTGIFGPGRPPKRPFGQGNIYSPEFGVLVGPGGPQGFGYGPRSAKEDKE